MSRLEEISAGFRNALLAKNRNNNANEYNISSPDALSDGDELGKGEKNGSIGGLTDIKTREFSLVKNKYSKGKEYNSSNA